MEILQTEESIKLYEYEQSKPDLDDDFLEHHGILGQRWGITNGPPYPLSSIVSTGKKLKAAAKAGSVKRKRKKAIKKAQITRAKNRKAKTMEAQKQQQVNKSKEQIIKSKDVKSMLRDVDNFTNKEITDLLERINVEQRLREEVIKQERAKKTWGKKVREGVSGTVKEEIPRTINEMVKGATNKGLKLASNRILKDIAGPEAVNKYGDKWHDVIDKLVPDILEKEKKK